MLKQLKSSGMPVMPFFLVLFSFLTFPFIFSFFTVLELFHSAEAPVNITVDSDNGGKQTGHHWHSSCQHHTDYFPSLPFTGMKTPLPHPFPHFQFHQPLDHHQQLKIQNSPCR
jgi:hypothetical protein